tara:strand:+ start:2390 stop:3562 length:1173 start_codon:yes stop_codon:yes gene_type:complete
MEFKKALVVGAGYVGSSLAILLSQDIDVLLVDNDSSKVNRINNRISPIADNLINKFLKEKPLKINAQEQIDDSIISCDIAILALPTDYNAETNYFNTNIIEDVLSKIIEIKFSIPIVIKSTVPIGFTKKLNEKYPDSDIIFSPEFLREGYALHDNLFPSRIVIGDRGKTGKAVGNLFYSFAPNHTEVVYMDSSEAESVKLFANTYLATRVTFFNELDSFCLENGLDTKSVIDGISLDPRIGKGYNNPSFGYGGYCLPKDTKQLLANFKSIPQGIFSAVVDGNIKRKNFIAKQVALLRPKKLGIYRLTMKEGSDNFRDSAIFDVIKNLRKEKIDFVAYEPLLKSTEFEGIRLENNLENFKKDCDLILANRIHEDIKDVENKIFTRDIFMEN